MSLEEDVQDGFRRNDETRTRLGWRLDLFAQRTVPCRTYWGCGAVHGVDPEPFVTRDHPVEQILAGNTIDDPSHVAERANLVSPDAEVLCFCVPRKKRVRHHKHLLNSRVLSHVVVGHDEMFVALSFACDSNNIDDPSRSVENSVLLISNYSRKYVVAPVLFDVEAVGEDGRSGTSAAAPDGP